MLARSYAQYIARRCKDPVLKMQFDVLNSSRYGRYMRYAWDDADFDPIADAIDEALSQWRRR